MPRPRKVPLPKPEGMLTTKETAERLGMSQATLYRYKSEMDDFPRPARLGGASYYRVDEVDAWKRKHIDDDGQESNK